ncbi:LOG family protein [Candidatus Woesearchaeota archaeon]|nr:MAG: LOG family protein [Candidatus Woesearchaeota archaeon]
MERFRVTIFGSARIKRNDPTYKLVERLAYEIAKEGLDMVTGGGPGLMEAASKGHEKGLLGRKVQTIGLGIKLPKEQSFNKHLDIKKEFETFSERLDTFMELSDVVVVAPGGIGTLLELFYTWQLVQVKHMCDTPIILLGKHWDGLIEWIRSKLLRKKLISAEDFNFIFRARSCSEAIALIQKFHEDWHAGAHVCRNFLKYKRKHPKKRRSPLH